MTKNAGWFMSQAGGGNPAEIEKDEDLRRIFGDNAVVSRVGRYNLIHLDNPTPEEIEKRVREFDPGDLFDDDCPLCRMLREQGGNVVYDDMP